MRRPHSIPQRTRIYVGCEGKSEEAYIALVRDICLQHRIAIHIEIDNLHPEGDPRARVEAALRRSGHKQRNREPFAARYILLDADQLALDNDRAIQATNLAARTGIQLIWQRPCHEALLLRHLQGHSKDQPGNTQRAKAALKKEWPEYDSPMEKRDLAKRIDFDALGRANQVEPDLMAFLSNAGLIFPD